MKNIILFLFILFGFNLVAQKEITQKDTTQICFPYKVAKKIALDLNSCDSLKEIHNLTIVELEETNNKVDVQKNIIETLEKKCDNYDTIVGLEKEKFTIVENQNKGLRKEIKKIKTNRTFIEIIGGAIITTLTTILIVK